MNYLIVTREFPPQDGGIAVLSHQMAQCLKEKGHDVSVLTWEYASGKWPSDFKDSQQNYSIQRLKKPASVFFQIGVLFGALRNLRKKGRMMRLIATTWNFSGLAAACASFFSPLPYVILCFGYEISSSALRPFDLLGIKVAFSRAKKILCSSRYTQNLLEKRHHPKTPVQFLPLGISASLYDPKNPRVDIREKFGLKNRKVLLTVARLFPRKGHDQVMRALPLVLKKIPDVFYLIVGQGPEEENLRRLSEALGIQDSVYFTGYVQDQELPAYYAACDIFVMPNREILDPKNPWGGDFEGFGLAFIEASASAKPVIAGQNAGALDAVKENQTGLFVDPNSVEEIAEAILRLLSDENLAKQMGEAGRQWVKKELDWPVLIQKYENAFENF